MRTYDRYTIGSESIASMQEAGRYNPARAIQAPYFYTGLLPKAKVAIAAGNSDDVDVFIHVNYLIVVSSNYALGYVGAEAFDSKGTVVAEAFSADEDQAQYLLKLQPINRAKRLADWMDL